jgi:dTDP-4-dehydrorhamnose reductase
MINIDNQHKILVFGRDGQIGRALQEQLIGMGESVIFLGRENCDLSDELAVKNILKKSHPRIIINAAAYTSVDNAELEEDQVLAINGHAPVLMANYIANVPSGIFVHYSSGYVFADTKTVPYTETDTTGHLESLCIYGQSKLKAEQAIHTAFVSQCQISNESSRYFVIRSSGVYGDGDNFIKTILRLVSQQGFIRVVQDQVGVPTSAKWLAEITRCIINSDVQSGTYHVVPEGEASWYEVAQFVMDAAIQAGMLMIPNQTDLVPIASSKYEALAKRRLNSRLSNQKFKKIWSTMISDGSYPTWQEQVVNYVKQIDKSCAYS